MAFLSKHSVYSAKPPSAVRQKGEGSSQAWVLLPSSGFCIHLFIAQRKDPLPRPHEAGFPTQGLGSRFPNGYPGAFSSNQRSHSSTRLRREETVLSQVLGKLTGVDGNSEKSVTYLGNSLALWRPHSTQHDLAEAHRSFCVFT